MFINGLIPLLESYFSTSIDSYWMLFFVCLAFLATVPCIIRQIIRLR